MIKIEDVDVYGWEAAIRGMRNPHNSWDKSDSGWCGEIDCGNCEGDGWCDNNKTIHRYNVGKNDLSRMKKLVKAGTDHSKFMRMITVTCDITAPLYWWKEFDTYKVGTVRNSCSTMHKIAEKEFTLDDFSHEHLDYHSNNWLLGLVEQLNHNRNAFLETKDKKYWWQMIQILPSSYNQRATVQLSYAVLRNMYHGRYSHKLDEWSVEGEGLCKWMETLPHSELITM